MRVPANALTAAVLAMAVTSLLCPALATSPPALPQSSAGQRIIERVEEIFHVHPERAETCVALLDGVLKDYPGTHQAASALAYLSYGNQMLGNAEAAREFQQRLEREFPDSLALGELLLLGGEKAEADGDHQLARAGYERAITVLDKHLDAQDGRLMRYTAGRCLAQLLEQEFDLPAEAFAVGKETAAKFPGESGQTSAWRFMADFAYAHGGDDGVPTLESMARGDLSGLDAQSRAAAMLGAARLYFEQKDYGRSAAALDSLVAAYPETRQLPDALMHQARLMGALQAQDADARLALWQSVIERYPSDPRCATAYMERANLFLRIGQVDDAISERKAGRDNAALLPVARGYMCVVLGDIFRDLGNKEEAIAAYQQARLLGGGTPAGWSAVRRLEALGVNPWPAP